MRSHGSIIVEGARENNLKNVNIEIPKEQIVVITGPSGSGKSSLAFDVIYAEGHRRYAENLSSQARFFLGGIKKPKVRKIENLPPAIALSQKSGVISKRSTVGTVTDIYDFLRLLFANYGKPHCVVCGKEMFQRSLDSVYAELEQLPAGAFLVITGQWKTGNNFRAKLLSIDSAGYARVRIGGEIMTTIAALEKVNDYPPETSVEAVVDRLTLSKEKIDRERIADSIFTAARIGDKKAKIIIDHTREIIFSHYYVCPDGCYSIKSITASDFSFNQPAGACPKCDGLGEIAQMDLDKSIPNKKLSLAEGAIAPWFKVGGRGGEDGIWGKVIMALAKKYKFSINCEVRKLPKEKLDKIIFGVDEELEIETDRGIRKIKFDGLSGYLERKYQTAIREGGRNEVEKYLSVKTCPVCLGRRLKDMYLNVLFWGTSIDKLVAMELNDLKNFFTENLKLDKTIDPAARKIIQDIIERLNNLIRGGVGYLNLDRSCATLSGGEYQRIRIALQIYSGLSGVLYVLDEPTVGLHSRDVSKLINIFEELKRRGNSLLIVEHDQQIFRSADWIIDMGPGAGKEGGMVLFEGNYEALKKSSTATGKYLSKKKSSLKRKFFGSAKNFLVVKGASHHNLKKVDLKIPLGRLVGFAGVSGSGKSSLVLDVVAKNLRKKIHGALEEPGQCQSITGWEKINKLVAVDQSPLGRMTRSNPATYSGVFTLIREIFAETDEAKKLSLRPGHFSFNMKGGRCEYCQGEGIIKVDMKFLDDLYSVCSHCGGKRYNSKVLSVKYHGATISDVLDMNIEYARDFFHAHSCIKDKLETFCQVGLGYLKLGQGADQLSGGEAQRVKLATELARKSAGRSLYILDEPTVGLHMADIANLMKVLSALVEKGNSVFVIEHNLDVLSACDYVIEMGPDGGAKGGRVIFEGEPRKLIKAKTPTGMEMRKN